MHSTTFSSLLNINHNYFSQPLPPPHHSPTTTLKCQSWLPNTNSSPVNKSTLSKPTTLPHLLRHPSLTYPNPTYHPRSPLHPKSTFLLAKFWSAKPTLMSSIMILWLGFGTSYLKDAFGSFFLRTSVLC